LIAGALWYAMREKSRKTIRTGFTSARQTPDEKLQLPFEYSVQTIRSKLETYGYSWVDEFDYLTHVIIFKKGGWSSLFYCYLAQDTDEQNTIYLTLVTDFVKAEPLRSGLAAEIKEILTREA